MYTEEKKKSEFIPEVIQFQQYYKKSIVLLHLIFGYRRCATHCAVFDLHCYQCYCLFIWGLTPFIQDARGESTYLMPDRKTSSTSSTSSSYIVQCTCNSILITQLIKTFQRYKNPWFPPRTAFHGIQNHFHSFQQVFQLQKIL